MNQLQENESSNEGREMEGMEFLEESPMESIKKFSIELESEESEPKGLSLIHISEPTRPY